MDNQHKLPKPSRIMVSKFALLVVMFLLTSTCKKDPEAMHQSWLNNSTNDSLFFQITRKHISDIPGWERLMPPFTKVLLGSGGLHLSGSDITMQIIRENYGTRTDSVEIYRNNILLVKWGGPLRVMHDSINHFFNERSWDVRIGGFKNRYEIATFTITDKDLKQQ